MFKRRIVFLVGPTASGKSAVAVCLAKRLNAEIISCDSMQIYRKMNILSSRPPKELTKRIKHHLLGFLKPSRDYNAGRFRKDALLEAERIYKKGKIPLFVGGTGLYMSAIIDGLFASLPYDKEIRRKLEVDAKMKGAGYLYHKLAKIDPHAAARIHAHDARRIIRALEVFLKCGKPISVLQKERHGLGDEYKVRIFALNLERAKLYNRIDQRVGQMFDQGLLKEARALLKSRLSRTSRYALGLPEIKGYLQGKYDLNEAKRLIKRNSRHYAKRQLTWFRKDKRVEWIRIKDRETPSVIAARIFKRCRKGGAAY